MLISGKADFKIRKIIRDEEKYYTNTGPILQEDTMLNMYTPHNRGSKYMRQKLV